MHFLLVTYGTAGDIYPFIGIGLGLKKRGHEVTVISHSIFRALISQFGLNYVDLNDAESYSRMVNHSDHWDPRRGIQRDTEFIMQDTLRKHYAAVEKLYVPGKTVAVAAHSGFGVRIAHEKLGIPFVSAYPVPLVIRSAARPFTQPIADWTMRILLFEPERQFYYWLIDRLFGDPMAAPAINTFRAELGLPPVNRIYHRWMHSPQCILGLYPRWLIEPVPEDWPRNIQFTGFPFFDELEKTLPDDAEQFLQAGDPPIVFTPGTAVTHAKPFFEAAVYACGRLKKRGLFLTRFPEQIPAKLPDSIRHFPFLPLSQTLPRSAALVSHGGIGTVAQALRAGVPQLMMPMNYDQPENARRITRMGIARWLSPKQFHGPDVAQQLNDLLKSPRVQAKCRVVAERFPKGDPVRETCDALEQFAQSVGPST